MINAAVYTMPECLIISGTVAFLICAAFALGLALGRGMKE